MHVFQIRAYLGRGVCCTWTAEKDPPDRLDHCYWGMDCYKDGRVTSGHLRRKPSILPTAARSPSCHQLQRKKKKPQQNASALLTVSNMLAHQDSRPCCISGSAYLRQHTPSRHWPVWGCHMSYSASSDLHYTSDYRCPSCSTDPSCH